MDTQEVPESATIEDAARRINKAYLLLEDAAALVGSPHLGSLTDLIKRAAALVQGAQRDLIESQRPDA